MKDGQVYEQRENESDAEFFRRSFLAFANEQFIVVGMPKPRRDVVLNKLANDIDVNDLK